MSRPYNFGAGPAALPEEILRQVQTEFLDWQNSGMSVIEMSNRSKPVMELLEEAESDLRELLAIPNNYKVIFLLAPARSLFSAIPMNLLRGKTHADYFDTGTWSNMAAKEAQRYCTVNIAADGKPLNYTGIPDVKEWKLNKDAGFVYYTANETIHGVEFPSVPAVDGVPLVSDMTSCLLSQPIDVSKFGMIFAGAQKNIGPAGLTIAIVRDDLLNQAHPFTPTSFDFGYLAEQKSQYYTNNSFACYIAGLMFKWVKAQGGLQVMNEINARKAKKLYDAIDASSFYTCKVDKRYRSQRNVCFLLPDEAQLDTFTAEAKKAGLLALKGHRSVGGLRASLYNAVPEKAVDALIHFMRDFETRHG